MSGRRIDGRTGFFVISVALLTLAGPAVAGVSLEMDRDRVFCAPAASFDADGQARTGDDPDTPNSGSGPADFVDMGACEYGPLPAFADFDSDGDVDLADVADFFLHFTGPK